MRDEEISEEETDACLHIRHIKAFHHAWN
jgi:hypothetical protein